MEKIIVLFSSEHYCNMFLQPEIYQKAEQLGFQLQLQCQDPFPPEAVQPDTEAVAVITTWGSPKCGRLLRDKMPALKIIGHAAGSVKLVIDPDIYQCDVTVISANPVMAHAVAEWSLLMTLLRSRNFLETSAYPGKPCMDWKNSFCMSDIKTMTIGLWGFGDSSKHLLTMLAPLKPKRLLVASKHAPETEIMAFGAQKVSFETLLSESQQVHCLVGVNKENHHKIGSRELALLQNGATIINCGRAGLIQEQPLIQELNSGRIHAVLDVFYTEPLPENSQLYKLKNLIMTPHNAGFPGRELFVPFLLEQFQKFFQGDPFLGEVSQERFASMTDETLAKQK